MKARKSTTLTTARRTVGYVRCSTLEQKTDGVSLVQQTARITAYCSAMAWTLSEVIEDGGASGKDLKRAGVTVLLSAVKRGEIDRVVVLKLDRITRSVRDLCVLLDLFAKHDVALVSIGETLDTASAGGRMVANMIATVAQWEREVIVERTTAALSHMRKSGTVYGRTPFGFKREGSTLVPDPKEQELRAEAIRLDRAGKSFREIARYLTAEGARARSWGASSVRAMLRSRAALEAA